MKLRYLALLALAILFHKVEAQDTTTTSFGKGLLNVVAKDSSWSVQFAPRIQFRANSVWNYTGTQYDSPQQNFLIRRARLKFKGFAYSPKLKYKIELGLSNRDLSGGNQFTSDAPRYILDAVLMWNFYENFELWAGQTKLPGNIERIVSSGNMQFIDRSLLNSRFNIDRDVGIQLHHKTFISEKFILRETFALSQGEGRNVTSGNLGGHQYTGRVEVLPFGEFTNGTEYVQSDLKREVSPKLMIGIAYDYNDDAVKTRSNLGNYMQTSTGFYNTDITTVFIDAMFKYNGFSFMGEFANREAENPIATEQDGTLAVDEDGIPTNDVVLVGNALNLQAGYLFENNYEVAGRFTSLRFDSVTNASNQNQYTVGVSKYIVGHKLKVQSDVSYSTIENENGPIAFRLGFDFHF
ncbi:porin [Marixanthomonas sp. SCSIO 43207]|uniref:porin n=1 Tax=Marixanthomonas sp. SCSIO 43207 TaxID=2779360 RepID=UPI001CA9B101|nr:porin [Marixanthomonas sp. SCSIO 43207]UAB81745.1 porin [Marixanthomonas sp. SCSIO 43207]